MVATLNLRNFVVFDMRDFHSFQLFLLRNQVFFQRFLHVLLVQTEVHVLEGAIDQDRRGICWAGGEAGSWGFEDGENQYFTINKEN